MTNVQNGSAYGEALFMLTEELGSTETAKEDVRAVLTLIEENPSYVSLIDSPARPREERLGLIGEAFGSLDKSLVNLIKILAEKRLGHILGSTLEGYPALYDKSRGIERVEAISAVPLTEIQLAKLTAKLEAITGKQIIVRNTHDPKLLGGMKLRYLGIQLDGTVKTKLDSFEKRLSELVI